MKKAVILAIVLPILALVALGIALIVVYGIDRSSSASESPTGTPSDVPTETPFHPPTHRFGVVAGYLPGWRQVEPDYDAATLVAAGYNTILVAFAIFSKTDGSLVNAFTTVSKEYVESLRAKNVPVILSIGGAPPNQTFHPNTTNSIKEALDASGLSIEQFADRMTDQFFEFKESHSFNGVDLDIEAGLQLADGDPYNDETFLNPTGTIDLLIRFIRKVKARDPAALVTMAPQSPNVSGRFGGGWDTIRATFMPIIQQVAEDITFVFIQEYNQNSIIALDNTTQPVPPNVGSAQGPWQVPYMSASAVCLMEPWPTTLGFPPFTNVLRPEQVVLGLVSGNSDPHGKDGNPLYDKTTMIETINCLRSGMNCDAAYIPPSTYPKLSGVGSWDLQFDQLTGFQFAKDSAPCVETSVPCTS